MLIDPPEFVEITVLIELPTVTLCTEFERDICGAISAATTVNVKTALEVPPGPVAVIV